MAGWATHRDLFIELWTSGTPTRTIAYEFSKRLGRNISPVQVRNHAHHLKLGPHPDFARAMDFRHVQAVAPNPESPPPSRAMINLAMFDAVVRRALNSRLGIVEEEAGEAQG